MTCPITPAIRVLREKKIEFAPHIFEYVEKGGTRHSSEVLKVDEHAVIKTLIFETNEKKPLVILMHGDCQVSIKNLARILNVKSILAVTLTMMMTTILLSVYLRVKRLPLPLVYLIVAIFLAIESAFLVANLIKFTEGGWITFLGGLVLISTMWLWYHGRQLRRSLTTMKDTAPFFETLKAISNEKSLPQYATHLVYLTASDTPKKLEQETIRSIIEKTPKRADVYWFLHVKTDNKPFTMKYCVEMLEKDDVYFIVFTLGFRIEPRINYFFEIVLKDLEQSKEVNITSRHPALEKYDIDGDIRFVLHSSFLSYENDLPFKQNFIMRSYYFLRRWFSIREDAAYGLDASNVVIEHEPIVVAQPQGMKLTREE